MPRFVPLRTNKLTFSHEKKQQHAGAVGDDRVIKFGSAKKHKQIGYDALTRLHRALARTLPNGAAVKNTRHHPRRQS